MADPKKPTEQKTPQPSVGDIPAKDTVKDANVKGGRARSGGDDDDLEELEVQR